MTGKRKEKFIPIRVSPAYTKSPGRVRHLRERWKQHEQLAVMEKEGEEGYEVIKWVDVLDMSAGKNHCGRMFDI